MSRPPLSEELDGLGEAEVRSMLANGKLAVPGTPHRAKIDAWLESKVQEREDAAAARREDREAETLAIAKSALSIANDANLIASGARDSAKASATAATAQASLASDANEIARSNLRVSRRNMWTAVAAAAIATIAAIAAIVAAYAAMRGVK